MLFEPTDTVVLTSATLAVEGPIDYVRQRHPLPPFLEEGVQYKL